MQEYLQIFQVIGFLLLIIFGSYVAIRYGLRALYPRLNKGYLTVLERVPLDHKSGSSILLVKVGEELLLIGAAQGRVSLLKEISPENLLLEMREETHGRLAAGSLFARMMESFKKRAADDAKEGWTRR